MTTPPAEPAATPKQDADALAGLKERFGRAANDPSAETNRKSYVEDVKFSSATDQWDEATKRARGLNRPALTFNRLNPVIRQIVGDYRQNKMAIKVRPAGGTASEKTADLLAGIIRSVEAHSNADVAYGYALECAARGGFGFLRVLTEHAGDDVFDLDLLIKPVYNPLVVYFDPDAREVTRADAEYVQITEVVPRDRFKREYPDVKPVGLDASDTTWGTEDGIRVAEEYRKVRYPARLVAFDTGLVLPVESDEEIYALEQTGHRVVKEREAERTKVVYQKYCGGQLLGDAQEYLTKWLPVVQVSGEEVNVEGRVLLRGAIHYAKDGQRLHNYGISTAVETTALAPRAPWLVTPAQIKGFERQWAAANTAPAAYLPYNPDPAGGQPTRINPPPQSGGELANALTGTDEIKATTGVYDASLGARSNETSGRAILARQQEGNTANFVYQDNLRQGIEQVGRVLEGLIPVVYDAERAVQTLDAEGAVQTAVVNQQRYDPLTGVTEILNSLKGGRYDVTVEAGPSFASRKAEAAAGMAQFIQALPQQGALIADLAVKNMDWPGANEIADRLKKALPPAVTGDGNAPPDPSQQQAAIQAQQAQQELQAAQLRMEHGKVEAENAKSRATVATAEATVVKARSDAAQALAGLRHPPHQPQPQGFPHG